MMLTINEQNISYIAKNLEGSFISNGQDRSIDSFDKMLFGVEEVLTLEDNSQGEELNYSLLYREYEVLCKDEFCLEEVDSVNQEEFVLEEEEDEEDWNEGSQNFNIGRVARQKMEGAREARRQRGANAASSDQNISIRLGTNLSEIHEEIHHNEIVQMGPIEEEFIDFVNTGQGASKINISKIEDYGALKGEKKVSLKGDSDALKQTEEDEVVAMLENELISRVEPHEESLNDEPLSITKKLKKQIFFKQNYKHILEELDDNDEKKVDVSQLAILGVLAKRSEWVQNRPDKSKRWKTRELKFISKVRDIMQNPYAEGSDEEEFQLEM